MLLTSYSEGWHFTTILLNQLKVKVGTLQQCCSPCYRLVLALYNIAAHPLISEGWHYTTMLLTQL